VTSIHGEEWREYKLNIREYRRMFNSRRPEYARKRPILQFMGLTGDGQHYVD